MTNVLGMLFVATVVFLVVVAPLWLIFHYITVWKTQRNAGRADEGAVNKMWATARHLEDRVAALEKLLDAEAPGWRSKPL